MGERLSGNKLAARMGVSRQRVDELIGEGRLARGDDGLIDTDEADALWANMDPDYLQRKAAAEATRAANEGKEPAEPEGRSQAEAFNRAKTADAVAKARSRVLDYEIKVGKYVLREEVKRGAFKAGKLLGSKLNNAANQLAPQLVGIRDVKSAHEIVQAYMTQLAADVRDELASLG